MAKKSTTSSPKPKPRSNGVISKNSPASASKLPSRPNASILTFFKKEPAEPDLFVQGRITYVKQRDDSIIEEDVWEDSYTVKRRRLSGSFRSDEQDSREGECAPPSNDGPFEAQEVLIESTSEVLSSESRVQRNGPFLDESDSEVEGETIGQQLSNGDSDLPKPKAISGYDREIKVEDDIPISSGDFEGFEGIEDFDEDDIDQGEEYQEQKWCETQRLLELEQEFPFGDDITNSSRLETIRCPLCNSSLDDMSDQEVSVHVNGCLDGAEPVIKQEPKVFETNIQKFRTTILRSPRPAQKDPLAMSSNGTLQRSAFSRIMAGHAEDSAWATAAASELSSRGKPSYQRTCPFYKILPGLSICVDAFRYGAVEGCQAYFLSHFHSDHYIGLTSSWCHGPIYCSRVTANLVKEQLKVDAKWVVSLNFEEEIEVPNTNGVKVTMIPANHCPGSSLFLYQKIIGKGKDPKVQRILHCGDFRACKEHLKHPLLMPNIVDEITKKFHQQRIDVCYLDTTYLNPKYAFPSQEEVIQACANLCVNLNKHAPDDPLASDSVVGDSNMKAFLRQNNPSSSAVSNTPHNPGRLLVVVGTYSIGKERICIGIAKALNSKIYAPAPKQRICASLEDPVLSGLLTTNPHEAQVHMTPLFEIRAETLDDYLHDHRAHFTHAVGFRPTGWNYRPPGSRFVESPTVSSVLYGDNWRSTYSVKDMTPQRGSTKRAACYGVPYSEHSSFRELAMFVCALRIDRIIPTVNVGSAKSRERMRLWVEKWMAEKRKNGLFKVEHF
jgi:DNA cross-link repair 1A protein